MRVKINKSRKPKKIEVEEVALDVSECVEAFNAVFDDMREVIIDRKEEINALKICILLGEHLMLEGPPGTAKSDLGRELFKRITGANVFKEQLMSSTQSDQIFGPIITDEYRKGNWVHNTENMLPKAHFACLEEVYRAPAGILNTMLTVLNEREFKNNGAIEQCPLISAIGTTNFASDSPEMEAFADRWLIWKKVKPLSRSADRLKAVKSYMARISGDADRALRTVSLAQIQTIQNALKTVTIGEDVYELYEQTLNEFKANAGRGSVSDRRYCHAIRVLQAVAILNDCWEVEPGHIEHVGDAVVSGADSLQNSFKSAHIKVIGEYADTRAEMELISTYKQLYDKTIAQFDEQMPIKQAQKLFEHCQSLLDVMKNAPAEEKPKTARGVEEFNYLITNFETLANSFAERVTQA